MADDRLDQATGAARRLKVDYATVEVLRAFGDARIPSLLLKGPTIVRWLYGPGEARAYADCDLLVPPGHLEAAGEVLAGLGFEPELDDSAMPGWWRSHGVSWYRASDDAAVDLHRTLAAVDADPQLVWDRLSDGAEPFEIAGFTARALSIPARIFHVVLHATQHGGSTRQADELARALEREDAETWRQAAELARELGALGAFTAALRFAPAGATMAEHLRLEDGSSVDDALLAAGTVDGTLTLQRFLRSDAATRTSIVRYKLLPPRTFMRKWSPLARRGRLGLALAYLWRPLWVVGKLPQTLRDWLAARRAG